jgi:hypothetical protein
MMIYKACVEAAGQSQGQVSKDDGGYNSGFEVDTEAIQAGW